MQSSSSHNRFSFKEMKSGIPPRSSTIVWMYFTTSGGYSHKWYQPKRINPIETFVGANRPPWFGHVSKMPDTRIIMYLFKWTLFNGQRSRGRHRKNWLNSALEGSSVFLGEQCIVQCHWEAGKIGGTREHWREMFWHKRDFLGACKGEWRP